MSPRPSRPDRLHRATRPRLPVLLLAALAALATTSAGAQAGPGAAACLQADVVALDQVYFWNRLGAVQPHGMIYALERDVVATGQDEDEICETELPLTAGDVRLRRDERPRPLVLRMNVGDCLDIHFTNLLATPKVDDEQPATREASIHVVGMQYRTQIEDGGMWVENDPSGLVSPGSSRAYRIYAQEEGTFLMYSGAAMVGGEGDNGSIAAGLFGAINVQPRGSRYFRSQVTKKDFDLARDPAAAIDPSFPKLDYAAEYDDSTDPHECWRLGDPILEMVNGSREIVHSDLTAIITGPSLGGWSSNDYPYPLDDPTYPHRNEPYREFTIIFHDEIGAVQAFPHFEDEILAHTLHSVRDAFAINYGTGGIGAEILANRLEVGPMHDCVDCKYEEFFLASWAVGDPAMIVDKPANYPCGKTQTQWEELRDGVHGNCNPQTGPKATKAFYPDDPSNVYHSYMNDRVKFRNLLAGSDDHHIFHLHAHQWLHSPRGDKSSYLDSQAIGQGTGFTYEIAYEGSGNRNKTVGDSIFHCHFYPHFAQGMWSLWRVHDVLETGTRLNEAGQPVHTTVLTQTGPVTTTTARALPDGEIAAGTPIPAIVPLPSKALPPPPTPVRLVNGQIDFDYIFIQADPFYQAWRADPTNNDPYFNPGYPFFIPGQAGHRAPHPPMDFAKDSNGNQLDGGLPRHVVMTHDDQDYISSETRLDFHKEVLKMDALMLPEQGTRVENLAMATHELAELSTPSAGGAAPSRTFSLNGAPRKPGAPYADPCWVDGAAVTTTRSYKAVDIELDVVFNKAGWHFPQQRIVTLLDDVQTTLAGNRPPEPLFFRANSKDCIEFELTNLVPFEYQMDDFQVRTPTDILGQHIHLVKFDVTSSDGGGNGFNYEDGTFSPEEVQERIKAIRTLNNCASGTVLTYDANTRKLTCPKAVRDPRFSYLDGENKNCNDFEDVLGAQTTVQRWWADPVEDAGGNDRTLRTVFTHDHFGPSTHQQAGLYAGLVIEPEGSSWYHNEDSTPLGTRTSDGGPTSWQAWIDPPVGPSYREFLIEFADFQLAYEPNTVWQGCPNELTGWADPARAVNPPGRKSVGPPDLYLKPDVCPTNDGSMGDQDGTLLASWAPLASGGGPAPPCPEAVSADDPGIFVVNYRNEPLAHRISDTFTPGATPSQVSGVPGDPSFAYATILNRVNSEMNKVPDATLSNVSYPGLTGGLLRGDPFTPILRAYEGDPVQIRVLVGAHEEEHNFSLHNRKWLFEPFWSESGYRSSQMMGISEWFDFILPPLPNVLGTDDKAVDLLYKPNSSAEGQWTGAWGILRQYQGQVAGLDPLPSNLDARAIPAGDAVTRRDASFEDVPESDVRARDVSLTGDSTERVKIGCPPLEQGEDFQRYDITAVAAREVLPTPTLVYNRRNDPVAQWDAASKTYNSTRYGPLHDPTAIMFVYTSDLDYSSGRPKLEPDAPVEPLILRAAADECIRVVLRNDLPPSPVDPSGFAYDLDGWSGWHMLHEHFNANDVRPSREVGLHPQLVWFDPTRSDGTNVGVNYLHHGKQTVAPGERIVYYWYAGDLVLQDDGTIDRVAIELGSIGLASSDPLKHSNKGAVGALVVEPLGSSWTTTETHPYLDSDEALRRTRAVAEVTSGAEEPFREFVTIFQDDLNLRYTSERQAAAGAPVQSLAVNEDPTESGQKAFNYRTEPIWFRMGYSPDSPGTETRDLQYADVLTNAEIGGQNPVTHIYQASPGDPVRFRVVHPAGHTQSHAWEVQGHLWQELPFLADSLALGHNPKSEWQGARHGVGPSSQYDHLVDSAGGLFLVDGAYIYRDYVSWGFHNGLWGLFVVRPGLP